MKKNNQNTQESSKRGIKGAFSAAKTRTIEAANKVTARDGAMVAVGAVGAVGVGLGIRAYRNHKAHAAAMEGVEVRHIRGRDGEITGTIYEC